MKRGTGSIKRQAAGRGLFAEVTIEAEPSERSAFIVDLDEDVQKSNEIYLTTIQAAIAFAEEKLLFCSKRQDHYKLSVTLRRLIATTADTTSTAVFYATLLAIEDAFDLKIPGVVADWSQRELKLKF